MFEIKMLSVLCHILGIGEHTLLLQFIDPSVYSRYPALFSHRALLKNLPLIRKGSIVLIIQPYSCQDLLPPNSTIIAICKLQNKRVSLKSQVD